jgi:hypothetical protein
MDRFCADVHWRCRAGFERTSASWLTIFFCEVCCAPVLFCQTQTGREGWRDVKLDPEEQIIAAALEQAELHNANERGAGARIEFKREGHAKVTITISRRLVEQARALDLTTWELFGEALRLALPGSFELARPLPPR